MGKISKWEDKVKTILEEHPAAREDDRALYYWILKEEGFDVTVSIAHFLMGTGYPNYETITRVRRKLQERFPELAVNNIKAMRSKAEKEFEAYARTT
jgi:hypothetical protein